MDPNEFIRNCQAHTLEELAPYEGKYVAWSEDGKHILAAASDLAGLFAELDRQDIRDYVIDSIPESDIDDWGGAGRL